MISFDDFKKIELKVARIVGAKEVEGSEKLVKLSIDLGQEERQILAGIRRHYQAHDLVGREIIVVANLEPRTLMGIESQGMLLAADDGGPVLLRPDREVAPGSEVR